MVGVKRKHAQAPITISASGRKKIKGPREAHKPLSKDAKRQRSAEQTIVESDTTESEEEFHGLSAYSCAEECDEDEIVQGEPQKEAVVAAAGTGAASNSREAHQKQKQLAKERKLNKPLGNKVWRSKKIWERLRLKSHVPKDERRDLVAELFGITTGRVQEFVFKHDATRVIQCALKYSTPEQRKSIANELRGEYRRLAESRYAKFLVGKILVAGDAETRDMVISHFYGSVKHLINHPEASWIVDDIYRAVATKSQKARLLREWYGAEFAVFKAGKDEEITGELGRMLKESPEKRKPIMDYCRSMINALVQKRMTGFTMLHDAMLQYYLATKPGSEEATEFLELIKGDEEGDLLKNLAFTRSGAHVVCLALAYGTAKDRKNILKVYKGSIEMMAYDPYAHLILLVALDVVDDTVLTSKLIFPELLAISSSAHAQQEKVLKLSADIVGRISILYPLCGRAKWIFSAPEEPALLDEFHVIRSTTSKKDPELRRIEIVKAYSTTILDTIAAHAATLVQSSFGCQFITEALLGAQGDKTAAVKAVAALANGDPGADNHISHQSHAGRMLKTLATGGRFNPDTKTIGRVNPPLNFHDALYDEIKEYLIKWATGDSSFVIVALVEAEGCQSKEKVLDALREKKRRLKKAARGGDGSTTTTTSMSRKANQPKANTGSMILLGKL